MFIPKKSHEFVAELQMAVVSNQSQQDRIKGFLQQACYLTFCTDYRNSGTDGTANYDAPYFNAVLDAMEQLRGVDVDAMAKWINAFAPIQLDKASGYFTINKQKVDALSLYLLADETSRVNAFWAWMIAPLTAAKVLGSADTKLYSPVLDWWLLDGGTRSAAKKSFLDSESLKKRIDSLIKECVKAGLDEAAQLLRDAEVKVLVAAKVKEAKFLTAPATQAA